MATGSLRPGFAERPDEHSRTTGSHCLQERGASLTLVLEPVVLVPASRPLGRAGVPPGRES